MKRLIWILALAIVLTFCSNSLADAKSDKSMEDSLAQLKGSGAKAEPTLQQILNDLGYSINVATDKLPLETFCALPGQNRVTMLAEYAASAPFADFGWFVANDTSVLHLLFKGSNVPYDSATFTISGGSIGFYLKPHLSPANAWMTQQAMNNDNFDHAWVFATSNPHEYLIAWEDWPSGGDKDYQDLVVKVRFANQPPEVRLPDDAIYFQCSPNQICFSIVATDANCDNDTLTLEKISGAGTFTTIKQIGPINANHCFTPELTGGNYQFIFKISDMLGAIDYDTLIIAATMNQAPVCQIPNDTAIFQCAPTEVSLPVSATDADGNLSGCTIISGPGQLQGGYWKCTPTGNQTVTVAIKCIDACDAYCQDSFRVAFTINPAPVCSVPNDTNIIQCTPTEVCLPIQIQDADNNLIGCSVINGPGAVVDGNWCYTPSGDEVANVTIKCLDECDAYCEQSFKVAFIMQSHWALINIDRTGSMALTNVLGQSRLERAKAKANLEIDKLLDPNDPDYPGVFQVAVMCFNSTGVVLIQDFTSDPTALHAAVNSIVNPRHDTPLAAAMCESYCRLPDLSGACVKYVMTFTDGLENFTDQMGVCEICEDCSQYMESGWNYDCDPSNPASCTEWQLCLADVFASEGINLMHYFGAPINPFANRGSQQGLEDLRFLKHSAEATDGKFFYYSDEEYVCGDANGDRMVNVSDAVFIVNYIFNPGSPTPNPVLLGDANWDGSFNISDAVYIIDFVFLGGDRPVCAQ